MTIGDVITLKEAVERVLAHLDEAITEDELLKRVLEVYPSHAKNPKALLRNHLRWDQVGKTMIYLDRQTIVPLRIAMKGVRFRISLTPQEVKAGLLHISPAFDYFLRRDLSPANVQLLDATGQPLPVRVVVTSQKIKSPLGSYDYEFPSFDLGNWFRANKAHGDGYILVTIEDWEAGHFRLEYEAASQRRQGEIRRKNQELADLLFTMLEAAKEEQLEAYRAIPTVYALLPERQGYPGDHWLEVINKDPRMKYDGFAIHYSEFHSWLDQVIRPEDETVMEKSYTPLQARQVYRFKAAFKYRPRLWRRIEIQGKQTLADLDAILRDAFNHDSSDHLSGFWKLVRRGTSKRFRQIKLGTIEPFGGGSGADLRIAGLGLNPGDELKYVYDFGDWIEHLITLEGISEPEANVKYPRVVEQNRPRYRDCVSCQAKGRKTTATWICLECSDKQQREVVICKKCLRAEHGDHYVEEILY